MVPDRGLCGLKSLPYPFASADATPLFSMAANDYLQISATRPISQEHWDSFEKKLIERSP